jgi:hypothetical protein
MKDIPSKEERASRRCKGVRAWNKIGKGGRVAENMLRLIKLLPFSVKQATDDTKPGTSRP